MASLEEWRVLPALAASQAFGNAPRRQTQEELRKERRIEGQLAHAKPYLPSQSVLLSSALRRFAESNLHQPGRHIVKGRLKVFIVAREFFAEGFQVHRAFYFIQRVGSGKT